MKSIDPLRPIAVDDAPAIFSGCTRITFRSRPKPEIRQRGLDCDPNPLEPGENYEDVGPELALKDYEDQISGAPPDDGWEELGEQLEVRSPEPKEPTPAKPVGKPTSTLAIRMAEVDPEPVEWLWEPYIPKGKLTSIEGDPGVGKSWLTMALTAQISRGERLPGAKHTVGPASVLLLTAEDGAADTIRPRLDAAGADVKKVHAITGALALHQAGTDKLKREIERVKPALVIVDPIVAYLPERTDMNSASAVRPVLMEHASSRPREPARSSGDGSR